MPTTGRSYEGVLALGPNLGYRRFEIAITALLGLIFLGFIYETFKIGPSASGVASGLIPHLAGTQPVYLAVGIIRATVMPHVIYLHSALTQGRMPCRDEHERVVRRSPSRSRCSPPVPPPQASAPSPARS